MTTEAGLKTVHMFASVDSYMKHKSEVAEGDLPLIPLHKVAYTGKMEDLEGGNVETWRDGNNWYRKHADGWIEQGGMLTYGGGDQQLWIDLNVPFTTTEYTPQITQYKWSGDANVTTGVNERETGRFKVRLDRCSGGFWYACGY